MKNLKSFDEFVLENYNDELIDESLFKTSTGDQFERYMKKLTGHSTHTKNAERIIKNWDSALEIYNKIKTEKDKKIREELKEKGYELLKKEILGDEKGTYETDYTTSAPGAPGSFRK